MKFLPVMADLFSTFGVILPLIEETASSNPNDKNDGYKGK